MDLHRRAEIHAALGEPARLAVVDELLTSDRSPSELSALLGLSPPLLAFHLDALERAGLIRRTASTGDRRRRYVRLVANALEMIGARPSPPGRPVVFVCTRNSARSQLAAALWRRETGDVAATSAGTDPAEAVHPGAVAAARREGLDLEDAVPRRLAPEPTSRHIVTVCDRAHEELQLPSWHWSIPDPVDDGSDAAFDRAVELLRERIVALHHTTEETP